MTNDITTLGALKASGYKPKSIKDELRDNLIKRLKAGNRTIDGIIGYDETVIPDLFTALLSQHNILLLGLRGQAKTRIARQMVDLLDEWVPYVAGSDLYDDPFEPISWFARNEIQEKGDDTIIAWLHRSERYTEKLATPDVTVADLIGDVDPIKAAALKLPYSDERVIHYGLIPRTHRQIFVINELPDLQARIQVALFNILEEKDIQIRGFKLRLPLDIQFIFTANPEDYTNRGSIVTPLKDRIESQILTHYPKDPELSKQITHQEARLHSDQLSKITVPEMVKDLVEQIAFEARNSEYVDKKSGVSARLTISAFENLISTAERRLLLNNEESTSVRLADFIGVIPAITGKIELVYEGEQEGPAKVTHILIGKAIKTLATNYLPDPEKAKKSKANNQYTDIIEWFGKGNTIAIADGLSNSDYAAALRTVPGLEDLIKQLQPRADEAERLLLMELVLHALSEYSLLSKHYLTNGFEFKDMFSSLFNASIDDEEDDERGYSRDDRY
ncbi:magnesium chelatase [Solitalea longa]|uniref:Magnesium chelatase n=1 Tax=Solitalea longa TaxID=2079460 RepID=A0A2S4ZZ84_9SPHI|nr:magnesium chelatase [Solitalea longa]POY35664.1 magnesium chelatase [Solitalea longa]